MQTYLEENFIIEEENRPTAVALGYFDGVHIGHQALVRRVLEMAKENGWHSVVHTFQKAPKSALSGNDQPIQIMSMGEKQDVLQRMGVDILAADIFSREYSSHSPEEFVDEVLVRRLGAKGVVCGFHYHFGKKGAGDCNMLKELCAQRGIRCDVIPAVTLYGEVVSSTSIRRYLQEGDMEMVQELLGRPYFVLGTVQRGRRIGTNVLGFPTINQNMKPECIPLKNGVYVSRVEVDGKWYTGVTNVGSRPSVQEGQQANIETHILGVNQDLYDREIRVEILHRLRDEVKFDSMEALKEQIASDKASAVKFFKKM